MSFRIEGKIVDLHSREIFEGSVEVKNGIIYAINRHAVDSPNYIIQGFVDAHVHIESSMLTPQNFGDLAVKQGTVAVVTDPHEIANVLGVDGINFMVENSKKSAIKCFFTIPSSVPATPFDLSGGTVTAKDIEELAATKQFVALSEMMNVPGVLNEDSEVMLKLGAAKKHNIPVDGHAPLLSGEDLSKYIASGITTDHECVNLEEAKEKIALGMKIMIREGSAAVNFDTFKSLIETNPADVMFCSDDLHPDQIIFDGHLRKQIIKATAEGYNIFDILTIASHNPIKQFKLDVGELRVGDKADFIVVENLKTFDIVDVFIDGVSKINTLPQEIESVEINNFNLDPITLESIQNPISKHEKVIGLIENELVTEELEFYTPTPLLNFESDTQSDTLKIVYINRYCNGTPQVALCRGFKLKEGAIASSVAHDSHNIIAVGCSDKDLVEAINAIIKSKGGLSTSVNGKTTLLPLPVAGIMSNLAGCEVAEMYRNIDKKVKELGCQLEAPFMTLSFMSLVVIPEIKIGEKGLFSYKKFDWI